MPDNMTIDGDALAAIASSIDSQALDVPRGRAIDLSNCQSNTVLAAVDAFNVWAAANGLVAQHGLQRSANDARAAAREFGSWDAGTGGTGAPHLVNGKQVI